MRELVSNVVVFVAVLLVLFLFGRDGEKPTVFQVLQEHVRGTCR